MATIKIEIGGFVGEGKTLKAARESAQQQASEALRGDYSPAFYQLWGASILVWREPKAGWMYRIIWPDGDDHGDMRPMCMSCCSRAETIAGAIQHAADVLWDDVSEWPEWVPAEVRSEVEWMHRRRAELAAEAA